MVYKLIYNKTLPSEREKSGAFVFTGDDIRDALEVYNMLERDNFLHVAKLYESDNGTDWKLTRNLLEETHNVRYGTTNGNSPD